MSNPPGSFIWYELMTPDPDTATSFYRAVVGWSIGSADPGRTDGKDYRMIGRSDGKHAGGVLRLTADMAQHGARPAWLAYLSVPDVNAAVAAIVADGGKILMPITAIPGVGSIAMVEDPQGVPLYVMTPTPPPGMPHATSDVFSPNWRRACRLERVGQPGPGRLQGVLLAPFRIRVQGSDEHGAHGRLLFHRPPRSAAGRHHAAAGRTPAGDVAALLPRAVDRRVEDGDRSQLRPRVDGPASGSDRRLDPDRDRSVGRGFGLLGPKGEA